MNWLNDKCDRAYTLKFSFQNRLGDMTVYYAPEGTDPSDPEDDDKWSTTAPTDVGTYVVKIDVAESADFDEKRISMMKMIHGNIPLHLLRLQIMI